MNRCKPIPDPVVAPLHSIPGQQDPPRAFKTSELTELRSLRVDEFLQARSRTPKSQKAYRQQDLQYFLNWTDTSWAEVTPRHIA